MRHLMITGTGQMVHREKDVPTLDGRPPGVIVETKYSMIAAGTLYKAVLGRRDPDPNRAERKSSYQISGIVTAVSPGIEHLKVGDAVCAGGAGVAFEAEQNYIPVHLCGKLKDPSKLEQSCMVNVAGTAMNAVRRSRSTLGEWSVVVGMGMVGQFVAQFLKLTGAYVIGSDIQQIRLDKAKEAGADLCFDPRETDIPAKLKELTDGHGADVALIAARCNDESLFDSVNEMVNGITGRIVIIGFFPVSRPKGLDSDVLMCGGCGPGWRDPEYKNEGKPYPKEWVRWSTDRNIQLFADLLCENRLRTEHLITHRFSYDDANEAYTLAIEKPDEALGIVLKY